MFAPAENLLSISRVRRGAMREGVTWLEALVLVGCGLVAALAIAWVRLPIRLPGHAIFYAVLPMAAGLAAVPRRGAGMLMSLGAVLGALVASVGPIGGQAAALVGAIALGPAIDVAQRGRAPSWRIHARFALAGLVANGLSWGARYGLAIGGLTGGGRGGGQGFMSFWPAALGTFALCGAVAGLVSAAVWFRFRPSDPR